MPFQTQINIQQSPGVEGDFASGNFLVNAISAEAGFISGENGIYVGRFVWVDSTGRIVNNNNIGSSIGPIGFVARFNEMSSTITGFLQESSLLIPRGYSITVFKEGDFLARNNFNASVVGEKVFASNADGTIASGSSGITIANYTETNFSIITAAQINELTTITSLPISNGTIIPPTSNFLGTSGGSFIVTSGGSFIITN